MEFEAKTKLDRAFEIGVILKGIDGLFETVVGILLFFVPLDLINRISPQSLSHGSLVFGAIYLLSHGLSKLILVIEILRNHLWAYLGLIILITGFIVYQTYKFAMTPSWSLAFLTIYDLIIVVLTVLEYRKRKSKLVDRT